MAKKIQISAVEMKAQTQVIVLDASFVARTVRAAENLKRVKKCIEGCSTFQVFNEDNAPRIDENGCPVTEIKVGKTACVLQPEEAEALYNAVIPFAEDLCAALIGEE